MPRLPFDRVDILIIDEIGKNISGAGMDTNVVGRKFQMHAAAPDEYPKVKRIFVRGLTEGDARQRVAASAWPSSAPSRTDSRDERRIHGHQLPHRRPRGGRDDADRFSRPIAKFSKRHCRRSG